MHLHLLYIPILSLGIMTISPNILSFLALIILLVVFLKEGDSHGKILQYSGQFLNIFLSDLDVFLLVWLPSRCYVGGDSSPVCSLVFLARLNISWTRRCLFGCLSQTGFGASAHLITLERGSHQDHGPHGGHHVIWGDVLGLWKHDTRDQDCVDTPQSTQASLERAAVMDCWVSWPGFTVGCVKWRVATWRHVANDDVAQWGDESIDSS